MRKISDLQVQYVTNDASKKTAVLLLIEEFEELLEDIEDLALLAERRDEPNISHEDVISHLKKNGRL